MVYQRQYRTVASWDQTQRKDARRWAREDGDAVVEGRARIKPKTGRKRFVLVVTDTITYRNGVQRTYTWTHRYHRAEDRAKARKALLHSGWGYLVRFGAKREVRFEERDE